MVVGTVWIAAEPCLPEGNDNANGGYAKYDQPACDGCAHSGTDNSGECCDSIYRNSCGRDDDNDDGDDNVNDICFDLNEGCNPGTGQCYPGLHCVYTGVVGFANKYACQLQTDNPEAHAATASLVTSSSSTGTTTKGGRSFVSIGLLGAAMMVMKIVLQRRRGGLLRRHQYNEVNAMATRMDV